ncbi:MAG: S8 family peptidase [Bacillota bacterium]
MNKNKNKKLLLGFIFGLLVFFFSFGLINTSSNIDYSSTTYLNQNKVTNRLNPPLNNQRPDYIGEQYYLEHINIFDAWNLETGTEDVTVAIVDTGIDTDHEEFVGRISELSYNVVTEEVGIEAVEDIRGHGTQVAGIIGANRNNDLGIKGMTDNVELLIIKADNDIDENTEHTYFNTNIANGITYAVDNGADIINLSLGSISLSPQIQDAVDYAYENQVIIVASAGNDANDKDYFPASFETTIAVGSIQEDYSLSIFSNFGDYIDVVAPGSGIWTTTLNNSYGSVNGTSFSAPQVAGALALLLSYKDVSYYEAYRAIKETAFDLGDEGRDDIYGYGLIDTFSLLNENYITISFDTNESFDIEPVAIKNNQKYEDIITLDIDHYTFEGWYLDENYTTPYTEDYIFTTDTTLFAKFEAIYYTVSFYDGLNLIDTVEVASGERISDYPTPEKEGKELNGWYYSFKLINEFRNDIITSNIKLYAKFTLTEVKVTFLDAFGDIFYETYIEYGSYLFLDENPTKPTTDLFRYEFYSWDNKQTGITKDTIYTPEFKRIFITDNVSLNPGVDTIYINEDWYDSGVSLASDLLSVETSGQVNHDQKGNYNIYYKIYYEDEIIYQTKRIVNVVNRYIDIQIEIEATVTTIISGTDFSTPQASSNFGEVEIDSNVNSQVPGKYSITYRVEYDGKTTEKILYVYVLEDNILLFDEIDWYIESGDEDE